MERGGARQDYVGGSRHDGRKGRRKGKMGRHTRTLQKGVTCSSMYDSFFVFPPVYIFTKLVFIYPVMHFLDPQCSFNLLKHVP